MALKADYVLRETAHNVQRNLTLTLAAIVTIGVSLTLFGSGLLLRSAVDNMSARWQDGVELIVFLQRDISEDQTDALEAKLNDHPEVDTVRFVDLNESREEAERLFARNDEMLERIRADEDLVPASYRIVPETKDDKVIESLRDQFGGEPGVRSATLPGDSLNTVVSVTNWLNIGILVVAAGLLVAALMLILNAIRMAMFARRREIEVMKLVGATNWFIRVPFMLEGVFHGMVGAGIAFGFIFLLDQTMERWATRDEFELLLANFAASPGEFWTTTTVVVLLGVVIGAAGSYWGISRYLKV